MLGKHCKPADNFCPPLGNTFRCLVKQSFLKARPVFHWQNAIIYCVNSVIEMAESLVNPAGVRSQLRRLPLRKSQIAIHHFFNLAAMRDP